MGLDALDCDPFLSDSLVFISSKLLEIKNLIYNMRYFQIDK
jgi:hypothetical protein